MQFPSTLDDVFRTGSHVRILRALDELPRRMGASAREIARRAELSHPTASSVLSALSDQGIVVVRRGPRADAYELNDDHVLTPPMRELFSLERRLFDELLSFLRDRIRTVASSASAAYVFGSAARGELETTSDIDLAVICAEGAADELREALDLVADQVKSRYGNRLSPLIGSGSAQELTGRGRRGGRLWRQIVREGLDLFDEAASGGQLG